VSVIVLPLLYW